MKLVWIHITSLDLLSQLSGFVSLFSLIALSLLLRSVCTTDHFNNPTSFPVGVVVLSLLHLYLPELSKYLCASLLSSIPPTD